MAKSCMCAPHQVERFGIRRPVFEELFEGVPGVFILICGDISRADLAPDFILRVRAITRNNLFKVTDGIGKRFAGVQCDQVG